MINILMIVDHEWIMKGNQNGSWISRTNQGWKLVLFVILLIASGIFFFGIILKTNSSFLAQHLPSIEFLGLTNVIFFLLSFCWLWFSVRCPACGKSVAGYILRNEEAGKWFTSLVNIQVCPSCKDSGEGIQ